MTFSALRLASLMAMSFMIPIAVTAQQPQQPPTRGGAAAVAAQPRSRISPHETLSTVIGAGGPRVTLVYGRPYSKAPTSDEIRKIWGGLVPYDAVWRLGADEATLLITQQPLLFGATEIPAGAYTLFMLPTAEGASKLIFSKQLGQWGLQYDEKQDLVRIDLTKTAVEQNVPQLTMAIRNDPAAGGGVIQITWENTQFSVPFNVKPAAAVPAPVQ